MQDLTPSSRRPLYDKRCREWTLALKQVRGEFRRGRSGDFHWQFMIGMHGAMGVWMLWASTIGPNPPHESPFDWLLPALGAGLLGSAALLGRKVFGVRYRFMHGEVCEIAIGRRIRWREPLVTLERVSFPWEGPYGTPVLTLHWTTHQRTIEIFPSINAAVSDIIRQSRSTPDEPPERPWRCERCGEENPESFDVCWKCGTAEAGQRR